MAKQRQTKDFLFVAATATAAAPSNFLFQLKKLFLEKKRRKLNRKVR